METKNNGGPAFPSIERDQISEQIHDQHMGMSLRDYFVAKIAQGDAAADEGWGVSEHLRDDQIAKRVALYFRIADAMLAERAK
jgi:hypothetical protein